MSSRSAALLNALAAPADPKEAPLDRPGCGRDSLSVRAAMASIPWDAELDDPAFDALFARRITKYYQRKAGAE